MRNNVQVSGDVIGSSASRINTEILPNLNNSISEITY